MYPCETTSIRKSLKLSTCPPALRSAVFLPIPGVKTEMEEETLPSSMHHSSSRLQFRYTIRHPVPYVKYLQDKGTIVRLLASADLTFHIIDGLTLKVSGGADMSNASREVYEPKETYRGYNANGIAEQQSRRSSSYSNENVLTYIKKIGQHSLNVMVGSYLLY